LNPPPKPNKPNGRRRGEVDKVYTYTFRADDPDDDKLTYYIWWGDGFFHKSSLTDSGISYKVNKKWDAEGEYNIRYIVQDENGAGSEWSDPLSVSMPRNKAINPFLLFLERLIERFPILEQILQPIYDKLTGF
jgi:hypothetical protein